MENPRLRYVELFPVETEDGEMFALRDPRGISQQMVVMSPDVFYLLQYFDGRHSFDDLRTRYRHSYGKELPHQHLQRIITHLDENFFLDNQNFLNQVKVVERDFLGLPARPAAHAGQSYAAGPGDLTKQIADFFEHGNGPGMPILNGRKKVAVKGLVAPHIDIRAGGPTYAHAYRELLENGGADCFVILGTGHSGLRDLYSILRKDFETPLGTVRCDLDFIDCLQKNYGAPIDSEVLPHRIEHTIEFQTIFLKYLFEDKHDFTIVPVLCSFSYHLLDPRTFPRERRIVDTFSAALRKTIAMSRKRVCIIASVDFSHVGIQYGDAKSPDDAFMQQVSEADNELIRNIERVDDELFFRSVKGVQDRYRVCGFSPIYTMLKSVEASRGKLLDYSSTSVDEQNSTVTFASMVLS